MYPLLRNTIKEQATKIELLENKLHSINRALIQKTEYAAGLEQDLENVIYQLSKGVNYHCLGSQL